MTTPEKEPESPSFDRESAFKGSYIHHLYTTCETVKSQLSRREIDREMTDLFTDLPEESSWVIEHSFDD